MKKTKKVFVMIAAVCVLLAGGSVVTDETGFPVELILGGEPSRIESRPVDIPEYSGEGVIELNDNKPGFTKDDLTTEAFERYSDLDRLGRCGVAYACIGRELMPDGPRESIGQIKPSGWQTIRYDDLIHDKYLYNRSHLIAFQLTGENANERNLITGTRHFNAELMLPYEEWVGNYVRSTGNHVLYRVTPYFEGRNLVATGVQMEALSVEDKGEGISFNIFVYNVQPGIVIDYATGHSHRAEEE